MFPGTTVNGPIYDKTIVGAARNHFGDNVTVGIETLAFDNVRIWVFLELNVLQYNLFILHFGL